MQFVPGLSEGRAPCSWIYGSLCGFMYIISHCHIPLFIYSMWIDDDVSNVFSLVKMGLVPEHRRPLPPNHHVRVTQEIGWIWLILATRIAGFQSENAMNHRILFCECWNVDPFSFPSCLWEWKMLIWEPKWKLVTICPSPTLRQPPSGSRGSPDAAQAHHGWHVHFLQPPVPLLPAEVWMATHTRQVDDRRIRKNPQAKGSICNTLGMTLAK